ncbi:hypothetical protein BsIDN1_51040 [Bacillus safensis]|uniref:Uncharacterized protein n=1 Tax=Bacillus safensis TaxID=561879 RepID=A0A5S9MIP8_BACIA|nr:hypothetical protein BsIDN1_51040 [Bacillus safensis]
MLIAIKLIGLDQKIFPVLQSKGINWGVTVITIAVLVPIATGDIGFKQLGEAMKSSYAWIALGAGILVALIAKKTGLCYSKMIRILRQRLCSVPFWQSAYLKVWQLDRLSGLELLIWRCRL